MSATLRIVHRTGFTYAGRAFSSFNTARMTPRATAEQDVVHAKVEITPTPWQISYTDYWGTSVTAFEVHEPHDSLSVVSTSTVRVSRRDDAAPGTTWEQLRDPRTTSELAEWLEMAAWVEPGSDLRERAARHTGSDATPREVARAVLAEVHREIDYVRGSTQVHTRAEEAWEARAGVCQDISHLVIGALRSVGIPARYVSGYLMPQSEPTLGVPYSGESHAWVQWWDGDWTGWDPTNDRAPGEHHVEVAIGRDYSDVAPLTGIFTGGATSDMFVEVELTQLD